MFEDMKHFRTDSLDVLFYSYLNREHLPIKSLRLVNKAACALFR